MASKRCNLSTKVTTGILSFPGASPQSQSTVERLLDEDREKHHCFYGPGFHNHLSHHLLAAHDLGAPSKLLQAIYDAEAQSLLHIDTVDRKTLTVQRQSLNITGNNWIEYLGQEKYYASFLEFFSQEVSSQGTEATLEKFIFSDLANKDGASMLVRFVGGAFHPLIQTGYGAEFGSPALVAQGIAQAAVHDALESEIFQLDIPLQDTAPTPLFSILQQVYESETLKPVMPYDPNALLSKRRVDALTDGRPAEIKRLASLWFSGKDVNEADLETKVEELFWVSTLLLCGTSKPGRKPRLDFFLMHVLNATLFLPSLFRYTPSLRSREKLLKVLLPYIMLYIEMRGRPRIDPVLMMGITVYPRPPVSSSLIDPATLGNPSQLEGTNPWPAIIGSAIHAPDAHTVKAIRALYYAATKYGTTLAGAVPGAYVQGAGGGREARLESHIGIGQMDGTVFVRAAGVVMDTLGWVTYGQKQGHWDRSALGWDDAWKDGE